MVVTLPIARLSDRAVEVTIMGLLFEVRAFKWIKSSASQAAGFCVEVARHPDGVAVRDSKAPEDGALLYTREEFAAFLDGAKRGEFDHLV